MAEEIIMLFNLRKDILKAPRDRRSRDAISILRRRVAKFSKTGKVKIAENVSEKIWSRGGNKPAMKLRLRIKKLDDGSVKATLAE